VLNLLSKQTSPNISIGAAQEWFGEKIINDKSKWYISINANIPVFDGGGAFARLKQGKIQLREATIQRAKTEDEMRLSIGKLFLEYDFWKKQAIDDKFFEKNG
jgi:outer membrane protein TolC